MIKKLKRRFITIYMIILSCFLITILTGIYLIVYHSEVTHSEQIMQMALQNNVKFNDDSRPNNSPPKKTIEFDNDTITITSAGNDYTIDNYYITNNFENDESIKDRLNSYYLNHNDFEDDFWNREQFPDDWKDKFPHDDDFDDDDFDDDNDFDDDFNNHHFDDDDFNNHHFDDDEFNPDDFNDDRPNFDDNNIPSHPNWDNTENPPMIKPPRFETTQKEPIQTIPNTQPIITESIIPSESVIEEDNPNVDAFEEVTELPQNDESQEISTIDTTENTTITTQETTTTSSTTIESTTTESSTSDTTTIEKYIFTKQEKYSKPIEKTEITEYEGNLARNTIYVKANKDGEIKRISYQYFESGDNVALENSINEIIKSGLTSGKTEIDNIKFRYYVFEPDDDSGYDIVFLDRAIEISTLNRLLIIFSFIGGLGLIILFGLSWLLASWAITPIAEAWDKQKQFIADASHELKTPLTVIATNTDVILSNLEDTVENQSKWLNYIKSETSRMSKLVSDLLYIAKSDVNEVAMVMNEFNLSHTVLGVCLVFESMAFENGKLLNTDIDENIAYKGDEDRIKQLITILVDNAIVHSNGNANIMVSLKIDSKDKIKLSVSNTNGEDIPKGYEERLFERFFRVDKARNRSSGSHGLGLNIAKSIVNNHNGTISVTSTHDHVVTFTVTL